MLILNMVHCYNCNTTVTSLYRHDFSCCKCNEQYRVCTDGGRDYQKRSYNPGLSKIEDRSVMLGKTPKQASETQCAQLTDQGIKVLNCLFDSTFIKLSDIKDLSTIELEVLRSVNLVAIVEDKMIATPLLNHINKNGNYFASIHL